jgi:cell division protein FtsN
MKIIIYILAFSVVLFSKSTTPKYQTSLPHTSINLNKIQELFYVQVGAFKNKKYALVVQKNLEKISYPTQITKRQVGTTYYYKLLIGSYQSREEAEEVKKMLPKEYKGAFILWDIKLKKS